MHFIVDWDFSCATGAVFTEALFGVNNNHALLKANVTLFNPSHFARSHAGLQGDSEHISDSNAGFVVPVLLSFALLFVKLVKHCTDLHCAPSLTPAIGRLRLPRGARRLPVLKTGEIIRRLREHAFDLQPSHGSQTEETDRR